MENQTQQDEFVNRCVPGAASGALHQLYQEREATTEGNTLTNVIVAVESVPIWGDPAHGCMHIVRYPPTGSQEHRRAYVVTEDQLQAHFEILTPAVYRVLGFGKIYDRPTEAQKAPLE